MESPAESQHHIPTNESPAASPYHLAVEPPFRPSSPGAFSLKSLQSRHSSTNSLRNHDDNLPPDDLADVQGVKVAVNRELTWWDVSALIINKMIGTGIFTGPPSILLYTGNKTSALLLWAGGFAYTLISMTLYLEYSRKLPYTGGELVYLDEILPRPALFSYTCYALYFVCLYTTATNSMQFARQSIIAATNDSTIRDERVMRLIAVVITTVICALVYFSTATGRRLNRYLAWLKIGLLISVFIAGAIKAGDTPVHDTVPAEKLFKTTSASALLQVLFSFHGWENATLVAGEIPDYHTLRKGFIRAVWIVGILYMLINIVFCYAIPWKPDGTLDLDYVTIFFGGSVKAKQAWAVLIAFSAVGSMVSVTYTCVMVKQTIAWANILPWSTLWRSSAPVRLKEPKDRSEMRRLLFDDNGEPVSTWRTAAPQGGIILHWIACIFYIATSSVIPNIGEAISFSGQLLTYAHAVAGAFLGFFFYKLQGLDHEIPINRKWNPGEMPFWLKPRVCQILFGWIYTAGSITILVLAAIGPYVNTDGKSRFIKGWYYSAITAGFFALSVVYYYAFLASEKSTLTHMAGVNLRLQEHGIGDRDNLVRQCDMCINYAQRNQGRSIKHRHAIYGYLYYNDLRFPQRGQGKNFLYWVFGGPEERHHPAVDMGDYVVTTRKRISDIFQAIWAPVRRIVPGLRSTSTSSGHSSS